MKKITLGILSLILSATAAFSFVGCENDPFMGLSAYEVAVQEGFKGTEAEWLASLHGTPGKDGSDLDAKELYESAKAEGYTGTYLEFLKEYSSNNQIIFFTCHNDLCEKTKSLDANIQKL